MNRVTMGWTLNPYPQSVALAKRAVSTLGVSHIKDLIFNRSLNVVQKTAGQTATAYSHKYAVNPDDTVTEFARETVFESE
jgi:hypothetical protein